MGSEVPSVGHFKVGHDFGFVLLLVGNFEVEDDPMDIAVRVFARLHSSIIFLRILILQNRSFQFLQILLFQVLDVMPSPFG